MEQDTAAGQESIKRMSAEDEGVLLQDFLGRSQMIYENRTRWFQNRLKFQNMRRGILEDSEWPYEGASNPHIPLTDQLVRNIKASMLAVTAIEPNVMFDPLVDGLDRKISWKLEQYVNDIYQTRMRVRTVYEDLVDRMLEVSGTFLKVGYERRYEYRDVVIDLNKWTPFDDAMLRDFEMFDVAEYFAQKYRMDLQNEEDAEEIRKVVQQYRAGKRMIPFRQRVVVKNCPKWEVVRGEDMLREPRNPQDIQQHRFFVHRFFQSVGDVRRKVREHFYDKSALEMLTQMSGQTSQVAGESSTMESQLDDQQAEYEGINSEALTEDPGQKGEDARVETYEVYTWHSPDPEHKPERRAIFTFFPAMHTNRFVRKVWLNRKRWPFKEFDYDNPSKRTYGGRCVASMIESLQLEVNQLHKSVLDIMPWMTGVFGTYDVGKLIQHNSAAITVQPGELLPARGPGAIELQRPPSSGAELLNEAALLQGQA